MKFLTKPGSKHVGLLEPPPDQELLIKQYFVRNTMLKETVELTMSHVGLGHLTEYALLVLFANSHSHYLTLNTSKIADSKGNFLYPAYFMTHLSIPINRNLKQYKNWEKVNVGVHVEVFGASMLESEYVLGNEKESFSNIDEWHSSGLPYMKANSLFIIDTRENGNRKIVISNPDKDCVNQLKKMTIPPVAMRRANEIRENGFEIDDDMLEMPQTKPLTYRLERGRDGSYHHTLIFAKFSEIMDWTEKEYLLMNAEISLPLKILESLRLLERETYYYGNIFPEEELTIQVRGRMKKCAEHFPVESNKYFSVAEMDFHFEIYSKKTNELLVMSRAKKLISLPLESNGLLFDFNRLLKKISNGNHRKWRKGNE
jgi:probable biosynthetic protein (TIGR04098 family)